MVNQAKRDNAGKVPMDLLPLDCLGEVAKVMAYGASKYGRDDWRAGRSNNDLLGCLLRHATAWQRGQDIDEESGCHHMAHVVCNALFIIWNWASGKTQHDDRWSAQERDRGIGFRKD